MSIVLALLGALRAALRTCTNLTLENLALRQQLALLRHGSKRPRSGRLDRLLWVWLSSRWAGWRDALHLVRPETVIRWHRQGFRVLYVFVVLLHRRRQVAHFNVTDSPTAAGQRNKLSRPFPMTRRRAFSSAIGIAHTASTLADG